MEKRFLKLFSLVSILRYAVCYVSKTSRSYDSIIVGLGSAGATAASTLAKAGKTVLALEAQDRVGGRVLTVPFGDGVVELGAEWLHGTEGSRMYQMALENDVSVLPQNTNFEVYESDGTEANKTLVDELLNFILVAEDHPPEKPQPLGEFLTKKLIDYVKVEHPEVLNDPDFISEFLNLANFVIDTYESSGDWKDISAQSDFEDLAGYQHMSFHRHGYETFFELLLNTYNNGPGLPTLDVMLNKEVTLIVWPKNSTGNVEVVCRDGSIYTADNVIVTVSLGVLKERYSTLFSPPVPDSKANIIEKLSIGVMGKVAFSFEQAWWPDDATGFLFLWSHKDREARSNDSWVVQIKEASTPMGSNNTLTVWCIGETAKLIETLPEEEVKSKLMEILKKFMGKHRTVPEPTGMIRSKWQSNPFIRGGFAYDNLLKNKYPNARATLAEPLLDATGSPKVLFAGEATDMIHYSTVHGASDSGFREASRLLSADTKKHKEKISSIINNFFVQGNLSNTFNSYIGKFRA